MSDSQSPTRRRWFQFRLRTLLVATLVLSLPLSWLAVRMERARKQREVIAAIEKAGGSVSYALIAQSTTPKWARRFLGDDVHAVFLPVNDFGDDEVACLKELSGLKWLTINDPQVTDDSVTHLAVLANLERLDISSSQISDLGIEHLMALPNLWGLSLGTKVTDKGLEHLKGSMLKELNISRTQVSDLGLKHLRTLPNLENLSLGSKVTDNGLMCLKELPKLRSLTLSVSQVTETGVGYLEGVTKLRHLSLNSLPINNINREQLEGLPSHGRISTLLGRSITDADLKHVGKLANLESLSLFMPLNVTDAGLEHLKELTKLRRLSLDGSSITDAGLEHLSGLTSLKNLSLLCNRHATDQGIKKLQEALPNCRIRYTAAPPRPIRKSSKHLVDARIRLLRKKSGVAQADEQKLPPHLPVLRPNQQILEVPK